MHPDLLDIGFLGVAGSVVLIAGWWLSRASYIWLETRSPLTPNCLLTRKPVLLISPPSPAWKFWSEDRCAMRFLYNHGYASQLFHIGDPNSLDSLPEAHFIACKSMSSEYFRHRINHLSFVDFSDTNGLLQEAIRRAEEDFI